MEMRRTLALGACLATLALSSSVVAQNNIDGEEAYRAYTILAAMHVAGDGAFVLRGGSMQSRLWSIESPVTCGLEGTGTARCTDEAGASLEGVGALLFQAHVANLLVASTEMGTVQQVRDDTGTTYTITPIECSVGWTEAPLTFHYHCSGVE